MEIRSEEPTDISAIHRLTTDAFAQKSFSDGTEPVVIDDLRAAGDLTLSLVALEDKVLVGHIAFSPIRASNVTKGWYGLGPISVLPELQRIGIGSSLIKEGLQILRNLDANGCALIGDPKYYCRFGFESDGNLHYGKVPDEHVQWISFSDQRPTGQLVFCPAFD